LCRQAEAQYRRDGYNAYFCNVHLNSPDSFNY
jgi:hypothetical protein